MDKSEDNVEEAISEPEAEPVEPEQVEPEQAEEALLQEQLSQALEAIETHKDLVLRNKADLENVKRRHEKELQNAHKFALDKFTQELLIVRDSLEMGLVAAGHEAADMDKMIEGTELTLQQLSAAMEKFGIVQVNPEGEKFNPDHHQAITMQESDAEPNTVIAVVQKGYLLNDRLVRPAMVIVSKKQEQEQEQVTVNEQA